MGQANQPLVYHPNGQNGLKSLLRIAPPVALGLTLQLQSPRRPMLKAGSVRKWVENKQLYMEYFTHLWDETKYVNMMHYPRSRVEHPNPKKHS